MAGLIGLGNIFPSLAKIRGSKAEAFAGILDFVFVDCALLFMSPSKAYGLPAVVDKVYLPLVGFSFKTPDSATFLKYEYSKYPYLSKSVVANSFLKQSGEFEVVGLRPIFKGNSIITNYVANQLGVKKVIEKYADSGGLFALNTLWGLYTNLALEELSGVKVEGTEMGGIGFKFRFTKLNFADIDSSSTISAAIDALVV